MTQPRAARASDARLSSADAARRDAVRTDSARLAAVAATGLLDTEVEEVFDRLTRLAVRLVRVPASFISLVDADRDFYKSACGFGEPLATARELSGPTFCHYTVQRTEPLVIPDTAADPVYRNVPTVRTLGVAAYVGVPLVVGGQTVGAFCTIDTVPRQWTADEVEVLVELAASAQREIELRGALTRATESARTMQRQHEELERSNQLLQEQAAEMEMQTEELHVTALHLEERSEEAEAANRSKSEFLSMMSHELRTPLNAIGGYAELLSLGVKGTVSPEQLDFLARIQRAGRHLQSLIGDILDFSRLGAGQVRFTLTDVPVDVAVADVAELLATHVAEGGVTFGYDGCENPEGGGPCVVRTDGDRLRQVLVNLVANAIKFTPRNGRVWVTCRRESGRVLIAVSDTGTGIAADKLEAIFQPFVQIDRGSIAARHQGVGLGLAISRELVRGLSGDITVTSTVGSGSTFTVSLPEL